MGVRGESFLFWWSARNGEGLFGGPKPLRGFAHGARGPQVHSRYQLSHSIDDASLDSSAIRDRLAAKRRLFPNSLGYVAAAHSFGAGYCATVRGEVPEACPRLARAITAVRARLLMRSIWLLTPSKLLFIDNSFTPPRIRP
jgi:hypothetical protein